MFRGVLANSALECRFSADLNYFARRLSNSGSSQTLEGFSEADYLNQQSQVS
jgi:hypothetical protein